MTGFAGRPSGGLGELGDPAAQVRTRDPECETVAVGPPPGQPVPGGAAEDDAAVGLADEQGPCHRRDLIGPAGSGGFGPPPAELDAPAPRPGPGPARGPGPPPCGLPPLARGPPRRKPGAPVAAGATPP